MRFLPLALALAITTPLVAQTAPTKRPMTFADLQAMKRVSDPQISPSGKWVLFSVTDVSLEKNTKTNHLWLVPLDGSAKERQLTNGSGESNGRFSPDGKWVMYSADDAGKGEIFVAAWDDPKGKLASGKSVTHLETEADGAIWAPDSQHILFVSDVYPECESHAPLGPQRNEQEASCNAAKDADAAKSPVHALVFDHLLYRHWNQYQGPKHAHIFYASVKGEAPTDLTPASVVGDHEAPTFSLGGPLGYAISPDGKEIAYVTNLDKVPAESTNNDIFVLQVGAEPSTAKKVSTSPGSDDGPQYSPDGKYLAWRSQARNGYESDKFDLVVMDRTTPTDCHPERSEGSAFRPAQISCVPSIRNLTQKFDEWVDEFTWRPESSGILFAHAENGEENLAEIKLADGHIQRLTMSAETIDRIGHQNPEDDGELGQAQFVPRGTRIIAVRMKVSRPAEIVSIWDGPFGGSPHSNIEKSLTHFDDALLSQLDLSKQESFWFSGANGTKVEGFILKPPNFDTTKKYPLKFLIHGGPQGAWGDAWSYRWNPELFAANGYVVVMINPRGSTGYGQKFLEEVSGDWGGRPYTDLMKGLDYAEAHYPFIDKSRECALGASYGGFMADWVLTHTHRFACIVTHDGMYNPQSAFGDTEELWFNEWEFRPLAGIREQGLGISKSSADAVVEQTKPAHPWDFYDKPAAQDPFRKWSPMLNIKFAKTPTLVVHSQRDYRLDVSEGLQLFTALQLLGVPSKMLYFPDEGHWVLKPQNSQLWYQTVNDWVDQWTHTNAYAK